MNAIVWLFDSNFARRTTYIAITLASIIHLYTQRLQVARTWIKLLWSCVDHMSIFSNISGMWVYGLYTVQKLRIFKYCVPCEIRDCEHF